MTRPAFLLLTVVACLLGFATAAACGCGWLSADALQRAELSGANVVTTGCKLNLPLAAVTMLLAVLAHAAGNVLNDLHDARNGADAANTGGIFPFTGGSRLIQNGVVTEHQTAMLAYALLLAVVLGGLLLALETGVGVLLLGLIGVLLAWAYSAPPLRLMTRGFGEPAVAGAWFLIVVGADYVQQGGFSSIALGAALSFGLLVAALLIINGCPDARGDALAGKRTLAVRLGPVGAAWGYLGFVLVAHGWLLLSVWLRLLPDAALWGLVSLPFSLAAAIILLRRARQPQQLKPALALTVVATLSHGLGMAGGFAWLAMRA
jgi:1,4-dihydroxy-2-naphthoate octaprenyltransferase